MYLDMASKEDKDIAEHWHENAKWIILYVSPNIALYDLHAISTHHSNVVDWFILCCCRSTSHCVNPGPPGKFTGYLLSREYLPAACRY